jgi:hypothetical protein
VCPESDTGSRKFWSLTEVPDCPQTQAPNNFRVQEKGPECYCISKSPVNWPLSKFRNGASMERVASSKSLLLRVFRITQKLIPIEICHPSSKLLEKDRPRHVPQKRPPPKKKPFSRTFLYIPCRVPSKAGPPNKAPIGRYALLPEPTFIYLSESPVNETLLFPIGAQTLLFPIGPPYGENCSFPEPSCYQV